MNFPPRYRWLTGLDWKKSTIRGCCYSLAALLVILGCDAPKPLTVPPELLGTWRTTDPRYDGLFFKIDDVSFTYSTVDGTVENYAIVKYERGDAQGGQTTSTHVLHGDRSGQKLQVSLLYESSGGGRFKFKNQNKTIWTRENNQR